jgi:aspartate/methionine/tyrosine aminotransferase
MGDGSMNIRPFQLERYFARYEFKVQYLLSPSDCESLAVDDLLSMASTANLEMWYSLRLSYTESPGHPALRGAVARLYTTIDADEVMIAAPEEAIFLAMHALLRAGDHVITIFPAYQSLFEIARSIGCTLSHWPLRVRDGRWRLDLDELAATITPATRLLVINFPHNPTGYLPTRHELDALIDLARRHNLFIFSDEMYRLLEYDEAARLPSACDLYERAVTLSGLSKSFALPGLRIGWLATHERDLLTRCLVLKDYTTICNSAPSEVLAIIALEAQEQIVARNLAIIQRNLTLCKRFFVKHNQHVVWIAPQAGSVAFPRWVGAGTVEEFCQRALDERGVMIVPGSIFDAPGDHFRVGLGRVNLGEVLGRLGGMLSG